MLEHYVMWSELESMSIDDVDLLCIAADAASDALSAPQSSSVPPQKVTKTRRG